MSLCIVNLKEKRFKTVQLIYYEHIIIKQQKLLISFLF